MSKNKAVKLHCILYLVSLSWAVWVPCTSRIRFLLKMMLYPGQTTMLVSKNYSRETKHCHASLVDRHFVGCLETPRGLSFRDTQGSEFWGVWVFETPRGLSFVGVWVFETPRGLSFVGVWGLSFRGLSFRDTPILSIWTQSETKTRDQRTSNAYLLLAGDMKSPSSSSRGDENILKYVN